MTHAAETVETIGGCWPGEVRWITDHVALVSCDHDHPLDVFEAACHDGADLDDVECCPIEFANLELDTGDADWIVGVRACLAAWVDEDALDEAQP